MLDLDQTVSRRVAPILISDRGERDDFEPRDADERISQNPRAAAYAGIIFSVLLFAVYALMRLSVPSDPLERGAWLAGDTTLVTLAMNLVPFAGVAFLWFVGALRDRLGEKEDQFFATVFLGSGVLLLTMLFAAAAAVGAIVIAFHAAPDAVAKSAAFHLGVVWPTE